MVRDRTIWLFAIGVAVLAASTLVIPTSEPVTADGTSYSELEGWKELRQWLKERTTEKKEEVIRDRLWWYPEGEIYLQVKPNLSIVRQYYVTPDKSHPVRFITNRFGLRDEEFSREKPTNTTRILAVGDSYTSGSGVNNSYRYTEILEERLNRSYTRSIQVINAGIPGYGMKDKFLILKHLGMTFQPDIVIVQVFHSDWMSRNQTEWIDAQVVRQRKKYLQNGYTYEEAARKAREIKREWKREHPGDVPPSETGFAYLYNITRLIGSDTPIIVFGVDIITSERKEFIKRFDRKVNIQVMFAPEAFQNDWEQYENYRDVGKSEFRIAPLDIHPNEKGHNLFAEHLYPVLAEMIAGETVSSN